MVVRYRPIKQWGRYNTKLFKTMYAARLKKTFTKFMLPKAVETLGIRVEDPNHPDFPRKTTPDVCQINHPAWARPPAETDHPLYKETPCLRFDGTESLAEGADQLPNFLLCEIDLGYKEALSLTKAVGRQGLPNELLKRANDVPIADLETLLCRFIMQAHQWDSTLEKLPRRRDPVYWWFVFPRYWGIPLSRKKYASLFHDFQGSDIFNFTQTPHMIIRAPEPLKAVCRSQLITETEAESVPDIYPIDGRIDLIKDHIYNEETLLPPELPSSPLSMHTLLINKDKDYYHPWTASETTGNAILCCFTAVMVAAKQKYGNYKGVLPVPIVTQCIQCCDNVLDFVIFQLNTTDFSDDKGIKNIVYFDGSEKSPLSKIKFNIFVI
ncbi:unnamed protein product [Soboliphyme baturini]|uniref:39S ribosomal protein L37, mitochondrial n=1 Tax=Soboliphyme baturini TaxID=241478 RepID=A0A183IJE6_9BILA|nr:unnamed protein product [Soboliphyme baturini]